MTFRAKEIFFSSRLRLFGLVWFWAFLCHVVQILRYSNSLPFGDQWDGEALTLLKPWVEGKLTLAQMFAAHNEHRIFFTRALDLLAFLLNSNYWDNRVFASISSAVYATLIAFLGVITCKIENATTKYVVLTLVFFLPITTANYENTLWGFQSSFYFLSLFALLTIHILSEYKFSARNMIAVVSLSLFSLGTLASGFLLAPIAAVMTMATSKQYSPSTRKITLMLTLCIIGTTGFLIIPKIAGHEVLRAQSLVELIFSMAKTMAWPVPIFPIAWLPLAFWLYFSLRHRHELLPVDKFFLGLAAWVFLQAAAIAYSRGHDLTEPPSRYTDILMQGMVANLYFCCQLFSLAKKARSVTLRRICRSAISVIAFVTGIFFALDSLAGLYAANNNRFLMQNNFIITRVLLERPNIETDNFSLPYPNKAALIDFLFDPAIQHLLRIYQRRLPTSCEAIERGVLSKTICAGEYLVPHIIYQQFSKVENPIGEVEISKCNIDLLIGVSSQKMLSPYLPVRLAGWIGPGQNGIFSFFSHHDILLVGKDAEYGVAGSAIRRQDVATAFGSMNYYWSGFDVTASVSGVPVGDYEILLKDPDAATCHSDVYVHMPSVGYLIDKGFSKD